MGGFLLSNLFCFYKPCFYESGIDAVLFHGAQAAGGDLHGDSLAELRHENFLFLQVGILPRLAGRVEFGGAGAVGISAAHH